MQGFPIRKRSKTRFIVKTDGNNDGDVQEITSTTESMAIESPIFPAVGRLNRSQPSKKSRLKLSFDAEDVLSFNIGNNMKEATEQEAFVPERSELSKKLANEKSTELKGRKFKLKLYVINLHVKLTHRDSLPTASSADIPPSRSVYTRDYLTQLRNSTPSIPKDLSLYLSDDSPISDATPAQPTLPPTEILDEAIVRALKERRHDRSRDYLSLDQNNATKPAKADSDEETYHTYVEEPVRLQKNMEVAQKKYKHDQIQEALYKSDSDAMSSVDGDEWENQQIAKAHPTLVRKGRRDVHSIPDVIPPIPTLDSVMKRMRGQLAEMKAKRTEMAEMLIQLEMEREEVNNREEAIQEKLEKVGKEYEELREDFTASGANRRLDEIGAFGTAGATV
jgi:hypothetical protein